ncbi:hypothetical protein [Sulfobacillus harzensis]|uniref:Uncharacterized protein n=1 Tax=Sulfobacillus harzensis TaxID=2729629 RepID=A0A7Y0L4J2_9FIRM|nr:hypothetical protein [Sulfobacillus harzensis]NMP23166.1 hypothetical protein [Sulfobacillus harzensis]
MKSLTAGFLMGFLTTVAAGGSWRAAVLTGIGFGVVSVVMISRYRGSAQE